MSITAIAFLLIYGSGLLLALARRPIWGLITYIATFYLHPPGRWWGQSLPDIRWSLLAAVITLIAYYLHKDEMQSNGSFFDKGIIRAYLLFTLWLAFQLTWSLNFDQELELLILYVKYFVLLYLIFRLIESEHSLKLFMWSHVLGCFIMGWDAYSSYHGGRFEGFVSPNINEANSGGLQLATGVFTLGALFLVSSFKKKAILAGLSVFIINAIVTTLSRSAFLATGFGGLTFIYMTPRRYKRLVLLLSIPAMIGFIYLTNPTYWLRIHTIEIAGEDVKGVDTGYGRVVLLEAQWRMFKDYPFGCGHRCTATLSTLYLDDKYLTGSGSTRSRASHSTIMTMLVEHGIPGIIIYIYMLFWLYGHIRNQRLVNATSNTIVAMAFVATVASLSSIFLGDIFVDYLKLESRVWFIGLLLSIIQLWKRSYVNQPKQQLPEESF